MTVYDDVYTSFGTVCRPFFEACGFDDDAMGATTMMYTRNLHE